MDPSLAGAPHLADRCRSLLLFHGLRAPATRFNGRARIERAPVSERAPSILGTLSGPRRDDHHFAVAGLPRRVPTTSPALLTAEGCSSFKSTTARAGVHAIPLYSA